MEKVCYVLWKPEAGTAADFADALLGPVVERIARISRGPLSLLVADAAAEAVTNPMLWYEAGGSPEKLRENLGRMLASVRAFLDIERVESLPMSEWLLRDWSGSHV